MIDPMVANTGKPTKAAECSARNGKRVSMKLIGRERNKDFKANWFPYRSLFSAFIFCVALRVLRTNAE